MTRVRKALFANRAPGSAVLAALLLASCTLTERQTLVQGTRPDDLQDKVARLEQALAELQRSAGPKSPDPEIPDRIARIGKDMADLRVRVEALEEQSRRIEGRAGEMERSLGQPPKELARLPEIERQVGQLAEKVKQIESAVARLAETPPLPAPAATGSPAGGTTPSAATERRASAQLIYDEGYALYKQGKYDAARERLREYVRLYPDTSLTDNAYFWIGETYYDQGEAEKDPRYFEKAILEYDKVVQQFPKGDKVASALLKQGLAFDALGAPADARILLKKVVREHPSSDQAVIAQKKLESLGE